MSDQNSPSIFYDKKINELQETLIRLNCKSIAIGWLRFTIAVLTAILIYTTWHSSFWIIVAAAVVGTSGFLFVVSKDTDNKEAIDNVKVLLAINKKELGHIKYQFQENYSGKAFEPAHHMYAEDIDLFGESSLYQFINRCYSEKGKGLFAQRLLSPLSKENILLQQDAAKELSAKTVWRQQFQAFSFMKEISLNTENRVREWLKNEEQNFRSPYWKTLLFIYPVITLGSAFLYVSDIIPLSIFLVLVVVFYLAALSISKKITPLHHLVSNIVTEINSLYKQLNWFEKENFCSKFLQQIQQSIKTNSTTSAVSEIRELENILNRFDVRLNAFAFFFLNTFLLWDLWQVRALQKWKDQNKSLVPFWFSAIAEIEVAATIGTLAFNHPGWCYPGISDVHFTLEGNEIGHPLIPGKQRVNNSFSIDGTGKIALITGSNMAGKSTFLRSIGINMVLAYAGAPVCAESFVVSVSKLMTSMRISDNLAENTSTFYAELKKLKMIIEAVGKKEKVFILLDEILRGTNSLDRHTGSNALIKQLIREDAVAVIATHDVELAQLENEFRTAVTNYHFDVQVSNNELYFDYKLKDGICRSMNASILMKKIGIQL
jgi:ABC-type multidrug transport system fused ATPase/permease subunit